MSNSLVLFQAGVIPKSDVLLQKKYLFHHETNHPLQDRWPFYIAARVLPFKDQS